MPVTALQVPPESVTKWQKIAGHQKRRNPMKTTRSLITICLLFTAATLVARRPPANG